MAAIMQVPAGASLRDFPEFPRVGTLLVLDPPSSVAEDELNGYSAQVTVGTRQVLLRYAYWQLNSRNEIGLLCATFNEATIPLGSKVRFVRRAKRTS